MAAVLVFLLIVLVDQIAKYFVCADLQPLGTVPVVEGVFHWTYAENTGAAFSMLRGQTVLLTVLPMAVCLVLAYLLIRKRVDHPLGFWALVMILGGAVGNLIDRIVRGFVVDFIDVRIINFAIFNVADIFVTVGAGLLIVYLIFFYGNTEKKHDE